MADDLDDFLKQAALRRQQRQQNRPARPSAQKPSSQQTSVEPPRLRPESQTLQPSIPTENDRFSSPYQPTVGNLSTNLPSGNVSRNVDEADERMAAHIKHAFQSDIGKLRSTSNVTPGANLKRDQPSTLTETPATVAEPQPSAKVSAVSMARQLRDPQTLRMAIIAHEIMKRPWQ